MYLKNCLFRTIVILLCLSYQWQSNIYGQVQTAFEIGDTIFRYSCNLKNETQRFSSIALQFLEFPCKDVFAVKKSSVSNADYELSTSNYREFYGISATANRLVGFHGPDPFLSSSNNILFFNNPVPLVRSSRKDDFYEQVSNEFVIAYNLDNVNSELRNWMKGLSLTNLKVYGTVSSKHTYKQKDQFDNLTSVIEGFSVLGEMNYVVEKIEGKKDKWVAINKKDHEVLSTYFKSHLEQYLSFYSYESLAEVARIKIAPIPAFYYHSDRVVGRHVDCSHKGQAIYVYPNPTYGNLSIKFTNANTGLYKFSISNIIGKSLWSSNLSITNPNQELPVELPALSKGVYIYRVSDSSGKIIQSRRLILVDP